MSLDYKILIRKKIFAIAETQTNILKCTLNNSKKWPAKLGMHLFGNHQRLWPLQPAGCTFFKGDSFHALQNRPTPFHGRKDGHHCFVTVEK